ncbi:hypothetical protein ACEPAH_3245 [Sanghuangporus vaninii]
MELWQAGWASFWFTLYVIWFSSLVFVIAQRLRHREVILPGLEQLRTWVEQQVSEIGSPFYQDARRILQEARQRLALSQPRSGERLESTLADLRDRLDAFHRRLDGVVSPYGHTNEIVSGLRQAVLALDLRLGSVDRSL